MWIRWILLPCIATPQPGLDPTAALVDVALMKRSWFARFAGVLLTASAALVSAAEYKEFDLREGDIVFSSSAVWCSKKTVN
jgi:hypothetical protein